jgi:hypothetical protein
MRWPSPLVNSRIDLKVVYRFDHYNEIGSDQNIRVSPDGNPATPVSSAELITCVAQALKAPKNERKNLLGLKTPKTQGTSDLHEFTDGGAIEVQQRETCSESETRRGDGMTPAARPRICIGHDRIIRPGFESREDQTTNAIGE